MVYVPGGVPDEAFPPILRAARHADWNMHPPRIIIRRIKLKNFFWSCDASLTEPKSTAGTSNTKPYKGKECRPLLGTEFVATGSVVVIVRVEVAGLAPGVMGFDENLQAESEGAPETQANVIALLNPFCALAVMVKVAVPPA